MTLVIFTRAFADITVQALASGQAVTLADFGTMAVKEGKIVFEAGDFVKKNLKQL